MTATATADVTKAARPPRKAAAKRKPRKKAKTPADATAIIQAPPLRLMPYTPGLDYQVANPRLINGRMYKSGELLIKDGLTDLHLRQLREQRIIVDIPFGAAPTMPIPDATPVAPMSSEDKKALAVPDPIVKGRVVPKHRGFGKWFAADEADKNVSLAYEGHDARTLAQKFCNETNLANGLTPTDEEIALVESVYVADEA